MNAITAAPGFLVRWWTWAVPDFLVGPYRHWHDFFRCAIWSLLIGGLFYLVTHLFVPPQALNAMPGLAHAVLVASLVPIAATPFRQPGSLVRLLERVSVPAYTWYFTGCAFDDWHRLSTVLFA